MSTQFCQANKLCFPSPFRGWLADSCGGGSCQMSRVGSLLRWGQQKAAAPEAASALEPDPDPPEITGRQTLNPIGGMHYLAEHTDIVRHLCRVAPTQFASASDDHSIVIWDTETHRSKAKLLGHTMPVTCMLVVRRSGVDGDLLLSGSTDKSVRVWDLETAQCISTWETHGGTIKTLADLRGGLCCSGGHDLCVWSIADGRLVSRVKWDEEYDTDVRQIIGADNGNVIIAACDDRQLLAYRVRRGAGRANVDLLPIKKLVGHREPVQCLHKLTEHAFASGSLDGSICLWDAVDLQMTQVLNYHEARPQPRRSSSGCSRANRLTVSQPSASHRRTCCGTNRCTPTCTRFTTSRALETGSSPLPGRALVSSIL
eukprot:m.50848 g.50848  ORF g.50848 m.50848 type:complete len:371 (+) comp9029_c0_seq2:1117-2229(+)